MANRNILPVEIQFQILESLVESGHTFFNLILASRSFLDVYNSYSRTLDKILIRNSIGDFLPFTWLLIQHPSNANACTEAWDDSQRDILRESWIGMSDEDFTFSNLVSSPDEERALYRIHSTIKGLARQLEVLSSHHGLRKGIPEEKHFISSYGGEGRAPLALSPEAQSIRAILGVYVLVLGDYDRVSPDGDSDWECHLKDRAKRYFQPEHQYICNQSAYIWYRNETLIWSFVKIACRRIVSQQFIKAVIEYNDEQFDNSQFCRIVLQRAYTGGLEHLYRLTRNSDLDIFDDYQRKFILDQAKAYKDDHGWTKERSRQIFSRNTARRFERSLREKPEKPKHRGTNPQILREIKYHICNSDEDDLEREPYDAEDSYNGLLELPFFAEEAVDEPEFLARRRLEKGSREYKAAVRARFLIKNPGWADSGW